MLVLTRKAGEAIVIGDGPGKITVELRRIAGGRVALAVDAPAAMRVLRKELATRIARTAEAGPRQKDARTAEAGPRRDCGEGEAAA